MKFNPHLENITSYEPGKPIELVARDFGIESSQIIKLASNENPLGPSPAAIKAIAKAAQNAHLYPDDSMFELKDALGVHFGVDSNNIIIGSGSDQILEFCAHAKLNSSSKVLLAKTTFAMYEIYSKIAAVSSANIFKTQGELHDLKEFLALARFKKPDLIYLCVPNNPLGECVKYADLCEFLDEIDSNCLVVIDGAYQEYAAFKDPACKIEPADLISRFPNCVYLGTFSKVYGLGGMRVGYGIARAEIIEILSKLRPPFNITTPSLAGAIAALGDSAHVQKSLENNAAQMPRFVKFAEEIGLDFIESYCNFITYYLPPTRKASAICQKLLEKGMIIRSLQSYNLNAVRITIGTEPQNTKFFELFENALKG